MIEAVAIGNPAELHSAQAARQPSDKSSPPKDIALDAGHVCQNLNPACKKAHAGTCAIAAYPGFHDI